jgi:hypothetical protein
VQDEARRRRRIAVICSAMPIAPRLAYSAMRPISPSGPFRLLQAPNCYFRTCPWTPKWGVTVQQTGGHHCHEANPC